MLNLTPALAFMVYNVQAKGSLNIDTLFKLVLLTGILARSVNMIASWFPPILAGVASYSRIQSYLLDNTKLDQRFISLGKKLEAGEPATAISLRDVCLKAAGNHSVLLQDVNVQIMQSDIVLCYGPMGSGKSTFAKALLAEIPLASGTIQIATKKVGYCDQTLWLPQGTVRDIICGFELKPNRDRYLEAISACCLSDDLASFPDGDLKAVLNGGINISGGQRQRLVGNNLSFSFAFSFSYWWTNLRIRGLREQCTRSQILSFSTTPSAPWIEIRVIPSLAIS
jgi:ATP-binding cassette, subfamily C (CFTR/MRP), member 1